MTGKINKNKGLWCRNFFLLWQGSLVSSFGDILYSMAMGFWVLSETGSTSLMGILMAINAIPKIIISPFAGVLVDSYDQRKIMVLTDFMCGITIIVIALCAINGVLRIWMVFFSNFLLGTCTAFFYPASASILPDLVEKRNVEKANSFLSMAFHSSSLLGHPCGGVFFTLLGAPIMFLINGLSFLFSALSELFIKLPKVVNKRKKIPYIMDLKNGLKYTWHNIGLRMIILSFSVINFFAVISFILILPLCHQTENLGSAKYGFLMASLTSGSLFGMAFIGIIKITAVNRLKLFIMSSLTMSVCFAFFPFLNNFYLMNISAALGGFFRSVMDILITSTIQCTIPQDKRGKIFGLLETVGNGLTPIAMATGGLLGDYFPIRWIIAGSVIIIFLILLPICLSPFTKKFFEYDSKKIQFESNKNQELVSIRSESCV